MNLSKGGGGDKSIDKDKPTLVITMGPTGSGKATLMKESVKYLNQPETS